MNRIRRTKPVQKTSAKAVGSLTNGVLAPALEKRMGLFTNLKTAWPDIAGDEVASFAHPIRFDWPRRASEDDPFKPATLVVACDPARALFFQHDVAGLLERVNLFLGFHAVERVFIKQELVETQKREPERPIKAKKAELTNADKEDVQSKVADMPDGPLKEALLRLGKAVKVAAKDKPS